MIRDFEASPTYGTGIAEHGLVLYEEAPFLSVLVWAIRPSCYQFAGSVEEWFPLRVQRALPFMGRKGAATLVLVVNRDSAHTTKLTFFVAWFPL